MPIFKYTVANKEGRKLSGTVEASDELTARSELNNLGFSILTLEESIEAPKTDDNLLKFAFEAVDRNSKLINGTIPGKTKEEVLSRLNKEYNLTVTAIWPQGASVEEISNARKEGQARMSSDLKLPNNEADSAPQRIRSEDEIRKEKLVREKIDFILQKIDELLTKYDKDIPIDQRAEINRKIDKLLRIKNSTNLDYILMTARDILQTIEVQEKFLAEKGLKDKQIYLQMETKNLLGELNSTTKQKTLTEDIVSKINTWESSHSDSKNPAIKSINSLLLKIKSLFIDPPEIAALKAQIKVYNKQLWEFAGIYFKEPSKEYREKIKNSLKTIWKARSVAKENLKQIKKSRSEKPEENSNQFSLGLRIIEELNSFSGWLLGFYIAYYFISLYLNSKDFGLGQIPKGLTVYDSHIFKYILIIVFLFHVSTALKVNFFKQNKLANIILVPTFLLGITITILNY